MEESIFTKIIKREIPASIIYEDDDHLAFLDISPFEKGHTLVIPKKQHKDMFEIEQNEFEKLMGVVHKIANHIEEKLNCGINIAINNKPIADQEVFHIHVHIVPRTEKKDMYHIENKIKYLPNEMENYKNKLRLN